MKVSSPTKNAIKLADLLGRFDDIKRVTKLPSGQEESDSHHSFALALTAYTVAVQHCPELDVEKILRFALSHDLLELVTGDESTLHHSHEAHAAKKLKEEAAWPEFVELFKDYPEITRDLKEYEKLEQPESAFVYVLDKSCTVWTHFFDDGKNLRELGILKRSDIDDWYDRLLKKIQTNLKVDPPQVAYDILAESFQKMRAELLDD